jgi:NAD(P)-dependent dehydrogenase (short-subunit alcohol dehydrogenase family)
VVTGGGGGIGRALARRLAAGGARVVVNDIDAGAAEAVAGEIGGLAVPADVATRDGVSELITTARERLGEIDVYCSNAGIAVAGQSFGRPDDDGGQDNDGRLDGDGGAGAEADWQRSWDVNVMAHVRAAELLLPGWLARGDGRMLITASAAGLLTMLGTAPYSVTKHAAVGYAEWLAATYGHRGLAVHCICPQGVRTGMLSGSGAAGDVLLRDSAIEPEAVAEAVWSGMTEGRFLILPHPEVAEYYAVRAGDTDKWLRGMNRLQQRIEQS